MKDDYYVYIYLDQTKPGIYTYKEHTFNYKPFYVGKGTRRRETAHLCQCMLKHRNYKNSIIKSIFKKTGEQPIHYRIYTGISNEQAIEIEKDIIFHFGRMDNNTGILANGTDGGDGANNFSEETIKKIGNKPTMVYQYNLNGEFIKCWDKSLDVSTIGINSCNIPTSIKRNGTCGGYLWSYEYFEKLPKKIKYQMPNKIKDIKQFDPYTGKCLKTFKNISEIKKYLGCSDLARVYDCLKNKINTAFGYKWSCENKIDISINKPLKKIVLKCDKDGNIIEEYKSVTDAANSINKAQNTLSTAISINRICGGYYWKFKYKN